jgi:hypothetical protein
VTVVESGPAVEQGGFVAAMASARAEGVRRAQNSPGGGTAPYLLSDGIRQLLSTEAMTFIGAQGPRPDGIDDVVTNARLQLQELQQTAGTSIATAQEALKGDDAAFIANMEAAKAKAKEQMGQTIDDAYNQLQQIGEQHPEAQSLIVAAVNEMAT